MERQPRDGRPALMMADQKRRSLQQERTATNQKKKGKPIISQSAKWYKVMTVYRIKIESKEYNEDYTFTEPAEGDIREEIAAALEEMKKGNIDSLEIKKEA